MRQVSAILGLGMIDTWTTEDVSSFLAAAAFTCINVVLATYNGKLAAYRVTQFRSTLSC